MNRKMVFLLASSAIMLQISCLGTPVAGSGVQNAGSLLAALQNAFS